MKVGDPAGRELEGLALRAPQTAGGRDQLIARDLERLAFRWRPPVKATAQLAQRRVALRPDARADLGDGCLLVGQARHVPPPRSKT